MVGCENRRPGPLHRRCSREGHRGTPRTTTLVLADSDELVASPEPKGRRRAGEDPLSSDLLDPARLNLAAVGVQQRTAFWHPRISTRTSRDLIRPPTGSATHRLAGATYSPIWAVAGLPDLDLAAAHQAVPERQSHCPSGERGDGLGPSAWTVDHARAPSMGQALVVPDPG
jgi:hypothetical protein